MSNPVVEKIEPEGLQKIKTLGSVQLHNKDNEIILLPTPSNDVNDPLNWSKKFRYYVGILSCFAVFINNFSGGGPAITTADQTKTFFGHTGPNYLSNVGKVAYFFTTTALMDGVGILFWMPIIVKYGRRPVYIICYTGYVACNIWSGVAKTYDSELASRIILGFFQSAGLAVAPLTIADLFFLHERGTIMAWYSTALVAGGALGNVIAGLVTINYDWRTVYYLTTALIGLCLVLVVFTMPETSFNRSTSGTSTQAMSGTDDASSLNLEKKGADMMRIEDYQPTRPVGSRKTYLQQLAVFNGTFSSESLVKIFVRPFGVFLLPPVLWSTMVTSISIGFVIAVNTNIAGAYQVAYSFKTWQVGLAYLSAGVGALLGMFWAGRFSDWTADFFTKRNGGFREPEMRLPAIVIPLVCMAIGMVLYGAGLEKGLHWMVPTFGLGMVTFASSVAMNIVMVYSIDSYRPIAEECIVAIIGFKGCFTFLLSFYTNPWAEKSGYLNAFGAMAGIAAAIHIMWVIFFVWGKQIRHATLRWRMFSWIDWKEDREVGE